MECGLCGQPISGELEALLPRHDIALLERQIARLTRVEEEMEHDQLKPEEVGRICLDCMHFMGPYGRGNLHKVVSQRLDQIRGWRAREAAP